MYITVSKEYLTNRQIIFSRVESAVSQIYWLKFSSKFVNFSRSYARKDNEMFFVNTVHVHCTLYMVLQKSSSLKLFGFLLRLSLFAWNFANLLAKHIHIYQFL